jgi:hypothetical protein
MSRKEPPSRMVLVECKPDERLIRLLGVPRSRIRHEGSKGDLCNRLRREENHIAVIDEDPASAQPSYLRNARLIEENHGVRVLGGSTARPSDPHVVSPAGGLDPASRAAKRHPAGGPSTPP